MQATARSWLRALQDRWRPPSPTAPPPPARIGLALGGGFARGMAHIGVLRVFERRRIPIHCISGVSSGSIVAAAYASGTTSAEIETVARSMKFSHVARWTLNRLGLAGNDRMIDFCGRILKASHFEQMKTRCAVVATDLATGAPKVFKDRGEVVTPIRASCAFPGIFQPVRWENRFLTDGAISMEVPAPMVRDLGAQRIISVAIPHDTSETEPSNMLDVVGRSLQILQMRTSDTWRNASDLVIVPEIGGLRWHDFHSSARFVEAGAEAARKALPHIRRMLNGPA